MAVLDRVPVDQITQEARQIHLGRALLTMIAAVLFAIGWLPGVLVLAVAWCWTAVKLGWLSGRRGSTGAD